MIWALVFGLAWADPPLSREALAGEAPAAAQLIDRCRSEGRACGATRSELAHAFVIRAVHAAVAYGTVDVAGAASARQLDPGADSGWEAVLSGGGEPEPWVGAWIQPAPAPPEPRQRDPLRLDHPDGSDLRFAMGFSSGQTFAGDVDLQVRPALAPSLSGVVQLHGRRGVHSASYPAPWAPAARPRVVADDLSARVGAGPRWSRDGGAEVHLLAAVVGGRAALVQASQRAVAEMGASPVQTWAAGFGVGGVGVHPLARSGRLALCWDLWVLAHARFSEGPANVAKRVERARVPAATPLRSPEIDLFLRYRPESEGVSAWLGAHGEWASRFSQPIHPSAAWGPRLAVGWTPRSGVRP